MSNNFRNEKCAVIFMDANKEIRRAVDTGKVSFGLKVAKKVFCQEKEK